jgi:hypothetical protein
LSFGETAPNWHGRKQQEPEMENPTGMPEISMDANELRREDVYTDSRVGTIRVLTPVTIEGVKPTLIARSSISVQPRS